MKKTVLLLFLHSLLSFGLFGQYAPFPTPGLELGELYCCSGGSASSFAICYVGDTLLCGKKWGRLGVMNNYVRAEEGKYYWLFNCPNKEYLMYDFSKNEGDTVITDDLGPLLVKKVDKIQLLNGEVRKRMELTYVGAVLSDTFIWVDGIGDIENGFYRTRDFEVGREQLVCVRDEKGLIYENPKWSSIDCDSILCRKPIVDFDYICKEQVYYFKNKTKNAQKYYWDFGDGHFSTEENPTHEYTSPGCYTVALSCKTDCLERGFSYSKKLPYKTPMHWEKAEHSAPQGTYDIQYLDQNNGWAITENTIWKTTDGGITWNSVPYPLPQKTMLKIDFKDKNHGIIRCYESSNSNKKFLLWTDNGETWQTTLKDKTLNINEMALLTDSSAIVSSQYQGVFYTKNRGKTWKNISKLPFGISLITDMESIGGDTVYLTGISSAFQLYYFVKTFDLENYEVIGNVNGPSKMDFVNAKEGWLSTGSKIYHSLDGGLSFECQNNITGNISNLLFADNQNGWVYGYQTGIYGTRDGGITWQQQACSLVNSSFYSMTAVSGNRAYAPHSSGLLSFNVQPSEFEECQQSSTSTEVLTHEWSLMPNPTNGIIFISGDHFDQDAFSKNVRQMHIINTLGQIVQVVQHPSPIIHMDVLLPNGIYYLVLNTSEGIILTKKFVLERL